MNSKKHLIRPVYLEDAPSYQVFEHFDPSKDSGRKRFFEVYKVENAERKYFGGEIGSLNKNMQVTVDLVPYRIMHLSKWREYNPNEIHLGWYTSKWLNL